MKAQIDQLNFSNRLKMQSAKYQLLSKPKGKAYPWLTYIGELLQGLLLLLFTDSQVVSDA